MGRGKNGYSYVSMYFTRMYVDKSSRGVGGSVEVHMRFLTVIIFIHGTYVSPNYN